MPSVYLLWQIALIFVSIHAIGKKCQVFWQKLLEVRRSWLLFKWSGRVWLRKIGEVATSPTYFKEYFASGV